MKINPSSKSVCNRAIKQSTKVHTVTVLLLQRVHMYLCVLLRGVGHTQNYQLAGSMESEK